MTSSTSSDPYTIRRGIVRFPPRRELPPGVTITKLPFLGKTWYERGFWYWCRRVGGVILFIITLAIYVGIIVGVMNAAGPPGSPGYLAVMIGEIAFSLVTSVFAFRHLRRVGNSAKAVYGNRRPAQAGAGAAFLTFKAGVAGAALMAVAVLLSAGFALAVLAIWFTPVLPTEQFARQELADELQMHPSHQQNTPRSKHYGSKNHRSR
jgi:hypothetical protein